MRVRKLVLVMVLLCSGCVKQYQREEKEDIPQTTTMTTTTTALEVKEPEILHFIDAWDEWHDVEIREDIKKHSYNYEYLSGSDNTLSYDDGTYYTRRGIDVSEFQGDIDWNKVKASGIEFVFVRLGYRGYYYGNIVADKNGLRNIDGAHKAGLDVGVYFFSQAINEEEALEEAQYVLKVLDGRTLELPIVFDPELIRDDTARTDDVSGEQFTANTITFLEAIKKAGYETMFYSNMPWEAYYYDLSKLEDYDIWYADYEATPQTPYRYSYWQYSDHGRVDGIDAAVDLDVQFIKY